MSFPVAGDYPTASKSRPHLGPSQPHVQRIPGTASPELKEAEREAHCSLTFSA